LKLQADARLNAVLIAHRTRVQLTFSGFAARAAIGARTFLSALADESTRADKNAAILIMTLFLSCGRAYDGEEMQTMNKLDEQKGHRSRDGLTDFEPGRRYLPGVRHTAVWLDRDAQRLYVFQGLGRGRPALLNVLK
jgi:hypothetical protein